MFNGIEDIPTFEPAEMSSGSDPENIWFYEKITLKVGTDVMREMFNRIKNIKGDILGSIRILVPAQYVGALKLLFFLLIYYQ